MLRCRFSFYGECTISVGITEIRRTTRYYNIGNITISIKRKFKGKAVNRRRKASSCIIIAICKLGSKRCSISRGDLLKFRGLVCSSYNTREGGDHNACEDRDNCDNNYELYDSKAFLIKFLHLSNSLQLFNYGIVIVPEL